MTHVTCRLTANDQLRNPTLGSRVMATFAFLFSKSSPWLTDRSVCRCVCVQVSIRVRRTTTRVARAHASDRRSSSPSTSSPAIGLPSTGSNAVPPFCSASTSSDRTVLRNVRSRHSLCEFRYSFADRQY